MSHPFFKNCGPIKAADIYKTLNLIKITLILLLAAGIIQALHWIMGDRAFLQSETKIATATGLGSYGK